MNKKIKTIEDNLFITRWENADNAQFYASVPLNLLPDFAIKAGLDTGCDIELLYPYIAKAGAILEVGAGCGRALRHIIDRGYKGKMVAIERSQQYCSFLESQFSDTVTIINADIKNLEITNKFDLILWLWSGIGDFSKEEQLPILKKLSGYLNANGIIALDIILPTSRPFGATDSSNNQYYVFPSSNNDCCVRVYNPLPHEIDEYGEKLGCKFIKHTSYKTPTDKDRMLYLLGMGLTLSSPPPDKSTTTNRLR